MPTSSRLVGSVTLVELMRAHWIARLAVAGPLLSATLPECIFEHITADGGCQAVHGREETRAVPLCGWAPRGLIS